MASAPSMGLSLPRGKSGAWKYEYFAKRRWKFYAKDTNGEIDVGGTGTVTRQLKIPFPHVIDRIILHHKDAAHADNTDNLAVILRRKAGLVEPTPYLQDEVFSDANIVIAQHTEKLGEEYGNFEPSIYDLVLTTSADHLIIVVIYFEELEEPDIGKRKMKR